MKKRYFTYLVFIFLIISVLVVKSILAVEAPTVETIQIEAREDQVALQGVIVNKGGDEVREYGFIWGTSNNLDQKVVIDQEIEEAHTYSTVSPQLMEGVEYSYRAFAVNSKGYGYGEIKRFTVPINDPPVVSFIYPDKELSVEQGSVINISIKAADDKKVEDIELHISNTLTDRTNGDSLEYDWDTSKCKPGTYEIKATASDGKKSDSKTIAVIIKEKARIAYSHKPEEAIEHKSSVAVSRSPETKDKYPKLSKAKGKFGQFSYREAKGGRIEIDPQWITENIVTITLPGTNRKVQVHKEARDNFIQAFNNIKNGTANINGKEVPLLSLIESIDGTFVPRHVNWNPKKGLSNHSWGIAIDINARNHFGYVDPQKNPNDPNLILWQKAFKPAGFSWGNSYRDSMHFEVLE
jgi:hypothetical protein